MTLLKRKTALQFKLMWLILTGETHHGIGEEDLSSMKVPITTFLEKDDNSMDQSSVSSLEFSEAESWEKRSTGSVDWQPLCGGLIGRRGRRRVMLSHIHAVVFIRLHEVA